MIAPISAMPIEPPTWRALFSTAEPTPALSTARRRVAAAALGVIVSAMPTPPSSSAGQQVPERRVDAEPREVERAARRAAPSRRSSASASRTGRTAFPAIGATRMIRTVIGRNAAPAWTAE